MKQHFHLTVILTLTTDETLFSKSEHFSKFKCARLSSSETEHDPGTVVWKAHFEDRGELMEVLNNLTGMFFAYATFAITPMLETHVQ